VAGVSATVAEDLVASEVAVAPSPPAVEGSVESTAVSAIGGARSLAPANPIARFFSSLWQRLATVVLLLCSRSWWTTLLSSTDSPLAPPLPTTAVPSAAPAALEAGPDAPESLEHLVTGVIEPTKVEAGSSAMPTKGAAGDSAMSDAERTKAKVEVLQVALQEAVEAKARVDEKRKGVTVRVRSPNVSAAAAASSDVSVEESWFAKQQWARAVFTALKKHD